MSDVARGYQSGVEPTTVVIANGGTLSAASDLGGKTLVGVITPTAWTAAAISFDVNADSGATFYPLYNQSGEVSIASADIATGAARWFSVEPSDFAGVRELKIRSGLNGATVAQGAERTLTLVVRAL